MYLTCFHKGSFASFLLVSMCLLLCHGKSQDAPPTSVPKSMWRDPQVSERYKKWLKEDVLFIITVQERREFLNLISDKQRDEFVAAFWERRNPTPGSPDNSFKEEHHRRIAYANEHFGFGLISGWMTDRGRLYIIYGPPDSVESHSSFSPPIEVWHYTVLEGCQNVKLTFTDRNSDGDYPLSDEDADWLRQMRAIATPRG
jgi:GWxTD domain-containing protein